jgi:hypothetical protein
MLAGIEWSKAISILVEMSIGDGGRRHGNVCVEDDLNEDDLWYG